VLHDVARLLRASYFARSEAERVSRMAIDMELRAIARRIDRFWLALAVRIDLRNAESARLRDTQNTGFITRGLATGL